MMYNEMKRFKSYLLQTVPKLTLYDPPTALNALYCCYCESRCGNTEKENQYFDALDKCLSAMSLKKTDCVWDIVCALCSEHERRAFCDGIRLGVALMKDCIEP